MINRTNLKTWLVISVFLLWFSGSVSATGTYADGNGTPANPFQINTPAQMDEIGRWPFDWDKYFILTADIDLSGYTGTAFNIIGNTTTNFTGVFDGNDHTISNFNYTSTGTNYKGLFGYVGSGGEIKNLGMVGVYVDAGTGDKVGGLAGWNDGTISNCHATGNVSGEWDVGGLVGWNYGTLLNCYAAGYVSGNYSVGGLVGDNYGTLSNCHATGTVTATGSYVGGLVGWNYDGTVSNCYATGDVSGDNFAGGLVGINDGTVSNCYATGGVWGDCDVGGLVGDNYGTLSNCYAAGYVSGDYSVGGLVGYDFSGSYTSCFWDSTVNSGLMGVGNISDPPDVMGRTTAQMQTQSTFTDYGWDFVGETANGTDDMWAIHEGATYPWLLLFVDAANYANYDLVKSGYVDCKDLDAFTDEWLNGCNSANNWCDGADFDQSGDVGFDDFGLWARYWLRDFLGDLDHLTWADAMGQDWQLPAKLDDFIGVHPRYLLNDAKIIALKGKVDTPGTMQEYIWLNVVKPMADSLLFQNPPGGGNEDDMRPSGRGIPWLALAYLMADEPDKSIYKNKAIDWMLTVCGYSNWVGDSSLGGAAGLVGVSIGYDWLYDELSDSQRETIKNKLIYQSQRMAPNPQHKEHWLANHNHVEHNGLAAAGFVLYGEPGAGEAEDWIRQADLVFQMAFLVGSSDGSSTEGHQYWGYSMESLLCYTEAVRDLMGVDYYDRNWVKKAGDFITFCTIPDFNMITRIPEQNYSNCVMSFGDSYRDYRSHGPTHILCRVASEYNDGRAQWLAEEMLARGVGITDIDYRAWANLLWYDEGVTATSLSGLPTFKHFEDIGWVVSRSGWDEDAVMVGFKCGPFHGHKVQPYYEKQYAEGWPYYHTIVNGHGHPDVGGFQIYAHGKWLATASGYSRYTSSRQKYTYDHCTILAGGLGQFGEYTPEDNSSWFDGEAVIDANASSSITKAESCADYDYIVGDAKNIYRDWRLSKFIRHFVYIKPDVVVIADELEASPSLNYFQWRLRAIHARQQFVDDVNIVTVQDPNYYIIENNNDANDVVIMDVHFVHPELANFSTGIESITQYQGHESKFLVAEFDSTSGGDMLAAVLHPRRDEEPACSITSSSFVDSVLYLTIEIGVETINVELDLAAQEVTIY